jgi:hypothetical protein
MNDLQRHRRRALTRNRAHGPHVTAPKHPHRGPGQRGCALGAASFTIQKTLHVGQETHKLVVMALLKTPGVARVFIDHLTPWRGLAHTGQEFPGFAAVAHGARHRHQAQGPQQDLAKLSDTSGDGFIRHRWGLFSQVAVVYCRYGVYSLSRKHSGRYRPKRHKNRAMLSRY